MNGQEARSAASTFGRGPNAVVDLAALREKHDAVARNLVTIWRWELHALLDVVEAAQDYLGPIDFKHALEEAKVRGDRLRDALDALEVEA